MSYTKVQIFNLALSALLLTKRIASVDTDTSVENQQLNIHYQTALESALQDMDLDSTSSQKNLELIETDPNVIWGYSYKYPSDCVLLRRIQSGVEKDNKKTQIKKRVAIDGGKKVVYTNEADAIVEYLSNTVPLSTLSAQAGLAVAYKLAILAAPLIAGKGALALRKDIQSNYLMAKAEAQEVDRLENNNFDDDDIISEFVAERTS